MCCKSITQLPAWSCNAKMSDVDGPEANMHWANSLCAHLYDEAEHSLMMRLNTALL